jgi:hypothetical protein
MTLKQLLEQHKSAVFHRWLDLVLKTYPTESASFLKNEPDRFANPVGCAIGDNLERILDALLNETAEESYSCYVEEIVKLRAVQDFLPSQAISFAWLLKKAVMDELGARMYSSHFAEWLVLDGKIDDLIAMSMDIYMACKGKIHQIQVDELRGETKTMMKMLGQLQGDRGK